MKKYKEAGKKFEKIKRFEEALDCYFINKNYKEILNLPDKPEIVDKVEFYIAQLLETKELDEKKFTYVVRKIIQKEIILPIEWQSAMKEILLKVVQPNLSNKLFHSSFSLLIEYCTQYETFFDKQTFQVFGKFYYQTNNYKQALRYFEISGDTNSIEYKSSRAKSLSYPDNIIPLYEIKEYDIILTQYKENKNKKLLSENLSTIIETLKIKFDYKSIITLLDKEERIKPQIIKSVLSNLC